MSHVRRRLAATAALVTGTLALSLATLPGGAVAAQAPPVDGASTGPDPYFPADGNGGYQVVHYDVAARYRPGTDDLTGRTTLRALAGASALASFHLDLRLAADSVSVDGEPASFTRPGPHELRVVPGRALRAGEEFTVTVRYHGRPSRRGTGTVWDGYFWEPGEVAAVGEPQIGPLWFAANETPGDKATYDVTLRVPRGQQAVSGGALVSRRAEGGWTAWHWRLRQPVSTYLAYFVAGRLEIRRERVDGRPVLYAVSRRLARTEREAAFRRLGDTPRVLRWMEDRFGDYPYSVAGGVVSSVETGFALETASRPFYSWWVTGDVVVHELAHQWFGDAVAVRRWRDTWLNEGFATYAEWLWAEGHGRRPVHRALLDSYRAHPAGARFWDLRVSDPGPARIFDRPVYERGAMMLAALRCRIGAPTMGTLVRTWVAQHRGGTGTGRELRDLAAQVSGQDLGAFFERWLDDPDRPSRTVPNGLGGCA